MPDDVSKFKAVLLMYLCACACVFVRLFALLSVEMPDVSLSASTLSLYLW